MSVFPAPADKRTLEEGTVLSPRFDASGLVTCVTTDAVSGELLMVAHMNAEALRRSIETGEAWYWSRSRQELWHKGATSGQIQTIVEMRIDCDQDAVWLKVEVAVVSRSSRHPCHLTFAPVIFVGSVIVAPVMSWLTSSDL